MSVTPATELLTSAPDRLGSEWERLRAPIADALRPGLPSADLRNLFAPRGLEVPPELTVLWGWHNGATAGEVGPGGFAFLSAEQALEHRDERLVESPQSKAPKDWPDLYWHASWIPFMTFHSSVLYVDTARTGQFGSSPVRMVNHHWEYYNADRAMSVAHLFRMWVCLLEADAYHVVTSGNMAVLAEVEGSDAVPWFLHDVETA